MRSFASRLKEESTTPHLLISLSKPHQLISLYLKKGGKFLKKLVLRQWESIAG